ncbi:hypothetical protein QEH68_06710 [Paenarthrobacter sp. OM7]|uniref:hypothetical protein n=1 Tax=Paenarthrobacter sp. OM7 TaxID=3041264 RepID=UPI00246988C5|nr:hypothetical protein [Paenarthrobacter sp. OM7]WGM21859.1 hypothetical protein QEH68_06710 [Paenarthrobacter sp. OM7]
MAEAVVVEQSDIESEWRPLTAAQAATVEGKSGKAWRLILAEPGLSVEEHLDANLISRETVKDVMTSMIIRVLKNEDSARSISKSADDWTKTLTFDSSVSTGEMYLNDNERRLLTPPREAPEYGMYVVSLGG